MEQEQNYIDKNKSEIKTLVHSDGRESAVKIDNKDRIGNGHFGGVYRVDITLASEEGKLRDLRKKFALKNFSSDEHESGFKSMDRAMFVYDKLKKAGIKTWTTYRQVKDENAILMTDGEKDNTMLISTSDASRSKNKLIENPINRIENYESALDSAIRDALAAGAAGISISPDAWFASIKKLPEKNKLFAKFRVKDNGAELVNIFIGDFDNIELKDDQDKHSLRLVAGKWEGKEKEIDEFYYEREKFRNLMKLKDFLDELIKQIVQYPFQKRYKKIANGRLGEHADKIAAILNQKGAWERFLNRSPEKMREWESDDCSHQIFKEEN